MNTIEQTIEYIEKILEKYGGKIKEDHLSRYIFKLNRIKEKNADKNLYLSVIGEFSSGKSTFINALLREEILQSRITQGTTKINTVIRYGKTLNMVVNNSKTQTVEDLKQLKCSSDEIRKRIKDIHLDSADAQEIDSVVIYHPSDFLKHKIVLIDTPGTNTPEIWHEDVTLNALHNLSDSSIILTDASQPLPETLINFVKENLSGILEHCMFLVTKIDMVRSREREEQLNYIKYTIKQKLGLKNPQVFAYAPLLVLEEKTGSDCSYTKKDLIDILNQSYKSENEIYSFIKEHKRKILNEKLSSLLGELLIELEEELNSQSLVYQNRHDILSAHTRKNLDDVCPYLFEGYCKKVDEFIKGRIVNLNNAFDIDLNKMHNEIYNSQNEEQVKNALNKMDNSVTFRKNDCVRFISENCKILSLMSEDTVKSYIDNLNKEYDGLNALLLTNHTSKSPKCNSIRVNDLPELLIITPVTEKGMKVGGTVAGATLGTIIAPGIGTLIGGALGALFGFITSPDLNTFKTNAWNNVHRKIFEQYNKLGNLTYKRFVDYTDILKSHVLQEIRIQKEFYRGKINYLINQDMKEKRMLEEMINDIDIDRKEISRCIVNLKDI